MTEVVQPVEAVVLSKPNGKRFIRPFASCGTGAAERSGFFMVNGRLRFAGYEVLYMGPTADAIAYLDPAMDRDQEGIARALTAINCLA